MFNDELNESTYTAPFLTIWASHSVQKLFPRWIWSLGHWLIDKIKQENHWMLSQVMYHIIFCVKFQVNDRIILFHYDQHLDNGSCNHLHSSFWNRSNTSESVRCQAIFMSGDFLMQLAGLGWELDSTLVLPYAQLSRHLDRSPFLRGSKSPSDLFPHDPSAHIMVLYLFLCCGWERDSRVFSLIYIE